MKKFLVIAFFLVVFYPNSQAQHTYYPLEKGKIWNYQYSKAFGTSDIQQTKTLILDELKEINGLSYFVLEMSIGNSQKLNLISTTYARQAADGSIMVLNPDNLTEEKLMMPAEPLKEGMSWTVESKGVSTSSVIIALDGRLVTPNKIYSDCLVTEMTNNDSKIRSYAKKDLGLVAIALIVDGEEKLMTYLKE